MVGIGTRVGKHEPTNSLASRSTPPSNLYSVLVFTQLEFLIFFAITTAAVWAVRLIATKTPVAAQNPAAAQNPVATQNTIPASNLADYLPAGQSSHRLGGPSDRVDSRRCTEHLILLVASYYFYAYWDYRFCGLLVFSTLADYLISKRIDAATDPLPRKCWLGLSVVINLSILGFFKYANFLIDSFAPVSWQPEQGILSNIILPVGISFFTFQTLSYSIDVYRGHLRPSRSLIQFSLYVAFFPQLVAGPIVRASEFLPQLLQTPTWSTGRFYGGAMQVLRGLVKKVLIADRLAEMVDVVFAGPDLYSTWTLWIAVIAYTGQIYYDFSGYTDIAIGVAKMLGFRFPRNFRHPYLSTSIVEFWRRWHITLSRWLRDYLYISMGGNRRGSLITQRNLLLTMTLGGLWHGAAWTFVLWGLWHGALLIGHRWIAGALRSRQIRFPALIGWSATFFVVMLGWVLFRADSLATAWTIYRGLVVATGGIDWTPPLVILAITAMVVEHGLHRTAARRWMRLPADRFLTPVLVTIAIWALVVCPPKNFRPFVYFQF